MAKSLIRFVLRNKKKLIFFFNNPINSISSSTFAKDQDIREQILISVTSSTMLAKSNFSMNHKLTNSSYPSP